LTGHLKGECSKAFGAPEQKTGQLNDPSSDIFQLGMLWAQLIKGNALKNEEGAKLEPFSSVLGKHWDTLVQSMLTPNPEERPKIQKVIESLVQVDELYTEA